LSVIELKVHTYAGGPEVGRLLNRKLGVAPHRIVAVPNGFDPADLIGVPPHRPRRDRDGTPLDLVFGGYWYGQNGPGILLDALAQVGPDVANLTIIGGISQPIAARFQRLTGGLPCVEASAARGALYQRLARADASVIPLNNASASESRIPAKTYDCLAVGTPVIAVCPPGSALLSAPGAQRFHHVHHRDVSTLADLLRHAKDDRASLRSGAPGSGPTRQQAAATMNRLLRTVAGIANAA
jgi:glycosyltransferase involved in cell wall biosynthesis